MSDYTLHHGDCLEVMAAMDAGSVDAVVCDPPYGLEFMGKEWDRPWAARGENAAGAKMALGGFVSGNGYANRKTPTYGKVWTNRRCLKCGHIASGGSPCQCEEPEWVTESGSTGAPNRAMQDWHEAWATEALRVLKPSHYLLAFGGTRTWHRLACAIEDAGFEIRDTLMWLYGSGFPKGTACLKPAWEPIILARKPGPKRALGIEECRVGTPESKRAAGTRRYSPGEMAGGCGSLGGSIVPAPHDGLGRWPANLILECTCDETREGTAKTNGQATAGTPRSRGAGWGDTYDGTHYGGPNGKEPVRVHTDPNCPCAMLDGQTGTVTSRNGASGVKTQGETYSGGWSGSVHPGYCGDSGGASRFFYAPKASRAERGEGNTHPTVKSLALMRWLVRLVARPGDVVLDPFMGSGTTGVACAMEGREFIGIERELEYLEISRRRIEAASAQGRLKV